MFIRKIKAFLACVALLAAGVAHAGTYTFHIYSQGVRAPAPANTSSDPYFSNVKLLMHLNGTYSDVLNHAMTVVGSPRFVSDSTFGTVTNFATQMSYLSTPSSSDFNFGAANFTIEAWVFPTVTTTTNIDYGIYYQGEVPVSNMQLFSFEVLGQSGAATLRFVARDASMTYANFTGGNVPYNQWSHVALVRNGGTLSLYMNGALSASTSIGASTALPFPSSYNISIGARSGEGAYGASFPGMMAQVRVTNGVARYTGSTYSIPTTFPDN